MNWFTGEQDGRVTLSDYAIRSLRFKPDSIELDEVNRTCRITAAKADAFCPEFTHLRSLEMTISRWEEHSVTAPRMTSLRVRPGTVNDPDLSEIELEQMDTVTIEERDLWFNVDCFHKKYLYIKYNFLGCAWNVTAEVENEVGTDPYISYGGRYEYKVEPLSSWFESWEGERVTLSPKAMASLFVDGPQDANMVIDRKQRICTIGARQAYIGSTFFPKVRDLQIVISGWSSSRVISIDWCCLLPLWKNPLPNFGKPQRVSFAQMFVSKKGVHFGAHRYDGSFGFRYHFSFSRCQWQAKARYIGERARGEERY